MNKVCIFLVVCLAFACATNKATNLNGLKAKVLANKGCCKCQLPKTGCCDCAHNFVTDYIDVPEPPVDAVPMTDGADGKARVPVVDKETFTESPAIDFGKKNRGVGMISAIAMLPDSQPALRGAIILTEPAEGSDAKTSSFPEDKAKTVGHPCDCADENSQGCKKFECGQMYGTTSGTDYSTLTAPAGHGLSGEGHTKCKCPAGVHCPCFGCNRCTSQFGQ